MPDMPVPSDLIARDHKLTTLVGLLSPMNPIRRLQYLRGREREFDDCFTALRFASQIPFVFGPRGVGKTSLAQTVAEQLTKSDTGYIYVPTGPGASALSLLREAAIEMTRIAIETQRIPRAELERTEIDISASPSIRFAWNHARSQNADLRDVNEAIRVIRELDAKLRSDPPVVIVFDELEEIDRTTQADLAFFIKQIGDQEFNTRFLFVGIADNVQQLIGEHASTPRYLQNVQLGPLPAQCLIDIIKTAAEAVSIEVPDAMLFRMAVIGSGFPHFAHLMGLHLLQAAIREGADTVDDDTYARGVQGAVRGSIQRLTDSYNTATQRGSDIYRNVVWAFAHSDQVDLRLDEVCALYHELAANHHEWKDESDDSIKDAIAALRTDEYGAIIRHTPRTYGVDAKRYRYHRFTDTLMKGHVRLRAEHKDVRLGPRKQ